MPKAAQSLSPNHIPIFRPYPGIALVLARRMARKAVEHQMRGEGGRVQYVPIAIIREQAQAYLEQHRELLDKAAEIVRNDPGTDNAEMGTEKTQLFKHNFCDFQRLALTNCELIEGTMQAGQRRRATHCTGPTMTREKL
jgi:hypothetical protein